ncbi:MAG: hypothetical protein U9M92_03195 [Patescibacteria group bacterium]|nr:hypothetical protein [Patescibacteria group bacterium]
MPDILTKKEAVKFLELDEKTFENYFKNADEITPLPRAGRGRFTFNKTDLEEWRKDYDQRTIALDRDDYARCMDFVLAQHFRGYVTSDWGTSRIREFGQKVTNWVKGQLGEIAVQKFFKQKFNVSVELDFDIHPNIVPQDITKVLKRSKWVEPSIGVGIKSSKPKSAYLVLGGNEVEIPERSSDVYIYCRPALEDDHLLRVSKSEITKLVSGQPHYDKYKNDIPDLGNIPCEIAGYCYKDELEKVTSIPGQTFDGHRYVIKSGRLHRDKKSWRELLNRL